MHACTVGGHGCDTCPAGTVLSVSEPKLRTDRDMESFVAPEAVNRLGKII